MGDCGQLWEEGQKSFTSGRSFWKGTELHNRGVSQALWCFSTERNPFSKFFGFSFICYEEYAILLTLTQPSAQWSNFTKTYWHSDTFFPPKLIIFFSIDSRCCRIWWNAGLFIFHWKKSFSMGLKRRVHHVSLDPIRYTSLLCLISVQIFLLISSFFRPLHLFAVGGETKNSMECLLDNSKQNARAHLFFDRLYQAKNMLN